MNEYYIAEKKYDSGYKKKCWDMAIGLQAVDDMKTSEYLYSLAEQHIAGRISNEEIENLLYKKYEEETLEEKEKRSKESDIVSNRIVQLLSEDAFTFSPVTLKYIHKILFDGIYDHAGQYRQYNISKDEPILNGNSVKYSNYHIIKDTLEYDFQEEKECKYSSMANEQVIHQISKFTSSIWQVHPFMEGNTRTTAVFMERYLSSIGFDVNNTLFLENAKYFRNALVRSNYADYSKGIDTDFSFLNRFYESLLFHKELILQSRDTILLKCFEKNKNKVTSH